MRSHTSIFRVLLPCILALAMLISEAVAQDDEIENLLINADFENGIAGWSFGESLTIDFDQEPVIDFGSVAFAEVNNVGPEAWVPEIHSPPFNLENGNSYTFSFWAKAEEESARTLSPQFEQLDTWVGMGQGITLSDEWQEFHFTGVWAHPSSPPAVVIHIGFDLQLDNAWFSHFRVYEGEYVEEDIEIAGQKKMAVSPKGRLATAWGQIKNK
jgi:carbohydrate binding protein with CBM4/9 domain